MGKQVRFSTCQDQRCFSFGIPWLARPLKERLDAANELIMLSFMLLMLVHLKNLIGQQCGALLEHPEDLGVVRLENGREQPQHVSGSWTS